MERAKCRGRERESERAKREKGKRKGGANSVRKTEERVAGWRNVGPRSVGSPACTVHRVVYLNAYGTVLIVHTCSHGPMN